MPAWNRTLSQLLNLFLESPCPLCQRSTSTPFCQDCQQQIQRCQLSDHYRTLRGQPPVFAWGLYSGTLKRAIAALKYENQPQLAQPLGHWLAQAWRHHEKTPIANLVVLPIPMHASKKQQRGYDQAEVLAQYFCEFSGLPLKRQGLERVQATTAQFGLSPATREQNLLRAFKVGADLDNCATSTTVLLLDDIYTTGATARSATQTLQRHGIRVRGILTVAMAQLEKS